MPHKAFGGDGPPVIREGGAAGPSRPSLLAGEHRQGGFITPIPSRSCEHPTQSRAEGPRAVSHGHFRRACGVWKEDGGLIKCSLAAAALMGSRAY